mgnify:CR=1 FL=1
MLPVLSKNEEVFRIYALDKADSTWFRSVSKKGGPKRDIVFTYEPL